MMRIFSATLLLVLTACAQQPEATLSNAKPVAVSLDSAKRLASTPTSPSIESKPAVSVDAKPLPATSTGSYPIGVLSLLGDQLDATNNANDRHFTHNVESWHLNHWLQNESIRYMNEHNWHNLEPIKGLDQFTYAPYLDENIIAYAQQQGYQLLLVFSPIGQLNDPYWYPFTELAAYTYQQDAPHARVSSPSDWAQNRLHPNQPQENFGFMWYPTQNLGSASVYCRFEVSLYDLQQRRVIQRSGPLKSDEYDLSLPWRDQLNDYSTEQQTQLHQQLKIEFAKQLHRNLDQVLLRTTDNGEAERVQQRNNQVKDVFILDQLLRSSH